MDTFCKEEMLLKWGKETRGAWETKGTPGDGWEGCEEECLCVLVLTELSAWKLKVRELRGGGTKRSGSTKVSSNVCGGES